MQDAPDLLGVRASLGAALEFVRRRPRHELHDRRDAAPLRQRRQQPEPGIGLWPLGSPRRVAGGEGDQDGRQEENRHGRIVGGGGERRGVGATN